MSTEYTRDEQKDILASFAAPLDPTEIQFDSFQKVHHIGARQVYDRLNTIDPTCWTFDLEIISHTHDFAEVKGYLTVAGITHVAIGRADRKETNSGAVMFKGPLVMAESHAIKRCAVKFGFAIELYPDVHWKYPPTYKGQSNNPPRKSPTPKPKSNPAKSIVTTKAGHTFNTRQFFGFAKGLGYDKLGINEVLGVTSIKEEYPHDQATAIKALESALATQSSLFDEGQADTTYQE